MRRTVVRLLVTLAAVAGTWVIATPAQAADWGCDQHAVSNGRYNYCWGPYNQYRTEIYCRRGDRPTQSYMYPGPWRNWSGANASVAVCPSGDFFNGEWGLNFR